MALAAMLSLPGAAHAAMAEVRDGVLLYTADAGEANAVGISRDAEGHFRVADWGDEVTLIPGPGCGSAADSPGLVCNGDGVRSISIALGDERDASIWVPQGSPVVYSGGSGIDAVEYPTGPLRMDNDGVADDGPEGRDNIGVDVEILRGSLEDDTLGGGPAGSRLLLREGNDRALGGSGPDVIEAATVESVGTDSGALLEEGRDTVGCGGGQDLVFADRTDSIASDCEARVLPARSGRYAYVWSGSERADRLVGPYGWGTATMFGRGGNDVIEAPVSAFFGPNRVDAGPGNDRVTLAFGLVHSYANPTTVYGGTGRDVIDVRQRKPKRSHRDTVRCGRQRDRVYADKYDVVARDCERVTRGAAPAR